MSKLSIWQPEEMAALRPDVEYTIVDLTEVSKDTWKMLFGKLNEFLEKEMFRYNIILINNLTYVLFITSSIFQTNSLCKIQCCQY
jgi:hypothetical protein